MEKGRNLRSVNTDGGVNLQFKLLSAIGIIIIVSGHCYHGGMELAYNWFPPYSYNLALFVFISGYFYKTDYEENIGKYIWKRTKRLLIPAYLWNIFYGGMVAFLGLFGFTIGAKPDLYNLFVMPFVDGEAFQYNLGSWFVYPLFLVCIINVLFRKFLKLIHLDNEFIVLIVYLAIGMIGINTAIENPTAINGIVKLFGRTMFFLPCYEFGRFYKAVLNGYSIVNDSEDVKRIINVSPQETAVAPNLTVRENLELIAEIYGFEKETAVQKAQNMIDDFELAEVAKSKAKTLSGGWQRRLSIAMALISDPEILFLDEPTLGLDVLARRELWNKISALKGKITVILTTHYLEEAESLSDRIGIMVNENLVAEGTADELKNSVNATSFEDAFVKIAEEVK